MTDLKKIEILEKEVKRLKEENTELRKQTADAIVRQYTEDHQKIIEELNELKDMAEKELRDACEKKKMYEKQMKQLKSEAEQNNRRQAKFRLFGKK